MDALPATDRAVGIVGLGLVGSALAARLQAAGFTVHGFDLRPEARDALAAAGGRPADTLAALGAAVGTAVLAVFDTQDVLQVLEGTGDRLLGPGSTVRTVVDCSTGEPAALAALSARLAARGIGFVEAPLSGSSRQIAEGAATMLLGGDAATIAGCAPVFDAIAARRVHAGGAGMGARAKLATNLVIGLNRAALAEGFVFAEALGIAPAAFLELVLATPATSAAAEAKGAMMVSGDFAPQSRIRQHLKDVGLMLADAAAAGQRLPLSETHAALMRAAVAAGDGELDNAALLRQLRRERLADAPPLSMSSSEPKASDA
ncbi:NAD(P)-dependent oxidoreductase [uncultured Xylophilus sp.]|uniref:NAD(P)-dependent oxidoreductase n=1 Tax=uncultured Xylophilus sp. TaxID=296832 RepID=UPI0025ECF05D|nr:NAD(P)-dependent oxidoreductase [uncultured Xylophilus sp.]